MKVFNNFIDSIAKLKQLWLPVLVNVDLLDKNSNLILDFDS